MKNATDNGFKNNLYFETDEGDAGMKHDKEGVYAGVYDELYQLLDEATVMVLWKQYRGTTITFPQKLYNQEYVRTYVRKHQYEYSARVLAGKLGLSERRIRQIMQDIHKEEK